MILVFRPRRFCTKSFIRHWDYEKVGSSTHTFGTRQLTFSSPPTYVDILEYHRLNLFLQLLVYCSYVGSLILDICIGAWFWTKYCNLRASAQLAESCGRDFLAPEDLKVAHGGIFYLLFPMFCAWGPLSRALLIPMYIEDKVVKVENFCDREPLVRPLVKLEDSNILASNAHECCALYINMTAEEFPTGLY